MAANKLINEGVNVPKKYHEILIMTLKNKLCVN